MKAIAEIRSSGVAPGALRREDLQAFDALLKEVGSRGVVLVTGVDEAKRGCATGLATAAAVSGLRAALVECDLSAPGLAKALGLASAPGLHEYLRWDAKAQQILQPLVLAGPESGKVVEPLVCIAAGKPTSQGPTLLASESFRHAIAKLRSAYDVVVLDGPSTDGDPAQLDHVASCADAMLACIERAGSTRRSRRRMRRRLRRLPPRFAGVVACD